MAPFMLPERVGDGLGRLQLELGVELGPGARPTRRRAGPGGARTTRRPWRRRRRCAALRAPRLVASTGPLGGSGGPAPGLLHGDGARGGRRDHPQDGGDGAGPGHGRAAYRRGAGGSDPFQRRGASVRSAHDGRRPRRDQPRPARAALRHRGGDARPRHQPHLRRRQDRRHGPVVREPRHEAGQAPRVGRQPGRGGRRGAARARAAHAPGRPRPWSARCSSRSSPTTAATASSSSARARAGST